SSVHLLVDQHFEIGADHAIAIEFRRVVIASGFRVLADLAEDPGIGGSGATDHHSVAAGFSDHSDCVFRRANVAVADDREIHGGLDRGNPFPARGAAITLLTRARVHGDGIQAAILGHAGELDADNVVVVPAQAKLYGERNFYGCAHGFKDTADDGQIFQQAGAAIAFDHALGRTSEVQIDEIEACIFD